MTTILVLNTPEKHTEDKPVITSLDIQPNIPVAEDQQLLQKFVKKVVGNGKVTHDEVFDMDESIKNDRIEKISESLR